MFTAALVILKLNVIWIYSCDAVILNIKDRKQNLQHVELKMAGIIL